MAWDEWESMKSDAAATQADRMRLNELAPPGGGGGTADLASTPAQKKAAANAIEQHLEPDTKKAGDDAEGKTNAAVKEFSGWDTAAALKKAHSTWERQVKALMDRLGGDKAALRNTSILFQNNDIGIGVRVRQSSNLDHL
ncbi:hypothetical protein [Streptomyces indicus]|uniref:Excreted virulence factor EspC, type VII ESX diderm n=1 Tax=Streptomyces indicus TaxID=417292 RepID=A0A1G9GP21_9ACTN|nr:hypothetical protein [Streptomyces indicus]SDL02414.1 hypothetical protein SAMN05421806_116119 [Streptomyces indicus]